MSNIDNTITKIEACVDEVKAWMMSNTLKLNKDKTEIIILGRKHSLKQFGSKPINVAGLQIDIVAILVQFEILGFCFILRSVWAIRLQTFANQFTINLEILVK